MNGNMIFFVNDLVRMSKGLVDLDMKAEGLPQNSVEYRKNRKYYDVVRETIMEKISKANLKETDYSKMILALNCQSDNVYYSKTRDILRECMDNLEKRKREVSAFFKDIGEISMIDYIDRWVSLSNMIGDIYDELYKMEVAGQKDSMEYKEKCQELGKLVKKSNDLFGLMSNSKEELNFVSEYIYDFHTFNSAYDRCQRRIDQEMIKFLPASQQRICIVTNHQRMMVELRVLQLIEEIISKGLVDDIANDLLKVKYDRAYDASDDFELEDILLFTDFNASKAVVGFSLLGDGKLYDDCLKANFVRPIKNSIKDLINVPDYVYEMDEVDSSEYYHVIMSMLKLMAMLEIVPNNVKIVINRFWDNLQGEWNIGKNDMNYQMVDGVMKRKGRVKRTTTR